MTGIQPNVRPAGRYTINETCELLGIHRNTLRRYSANGLIRYNIHKSTMGKFYTGLEILRFWNQTR